MPHTITSEQYGEAYKRGFRRTEVVLNKLGADPSNAAEVAQGAWAHGWARRHQLKDPDRVVEWVNAIAINRIRTVGAKSRRMVALSAAGPEPKIPPTVNPVLIDLHNALRHCPEGQREIVEAFYLEGRTSAEVAAGLGISINALHKRLSRACRAMKAALNGKTN